MKRVRRSRPKVPAPMVASLEGWNCAAATLVACQWPRLPHIRQRGQGLIIHVTSVVRRIYFLLAHSTAPVMGMKLVGESHIA